MSLKKKIFWIGILFMALLITGLFLFSSWPSSSLGFHSRVEALGLRGTSRVSRPLSKTQAQRLETHFLDIPAPSHSSTVSGSNRVLSTINQVDNINRLNERQQQ